MLICNVHMLEAWLSWEEIAEQKKYIFQLTCCATVAIHPQPVPGLGISNAELVVHSIGCLTSVSQIHTQLVLPLRADFVEVLQTCGNTRVIHLSYKRRQTGLDRHRRTIAWVRKIGYLSCGAMLAQNEKGTVLETISALQITAAWSAWRKVTKASTAWSSLSSICKQIKCSPASTHLLFTPLH